MLRDNFCFPNTNVRPVLREYSEHRAAVIRNIIEHYYGSSFVVLARALLSDPVYLVKTRMSGLASLEVYLKIVWGIAVAYGGRPNFTYMAPGEARSFTSDIEDDILGTVSLAILSLIRQRLIALGQMCERAQQLKAYTMRKWFHQRYEAVLKSFKATFRRDLFTSDVLPMVPDAIQKQWKDVQDGGILEMDFVATVLASFRSGEYVATGRLSTHPPIDVDDFIIMGEERFQHPLMGATAAHKRAFDQRNIRYEMSAEGLLTPYVDVNPFACIGSRAVDLSAISTLPFVKPEHCLPDDGQKVASEIESKEDVALPESGSNPTDHVKLHFGRDINSLKEAEKEKVLYGGAKQQTFFKSLSKSKQATFLKGRLLKPAPLPAAISELAAVLKSWDNKQELTLEECEMLAAGRILATKGQLTLEQGQLCRREVN